MRLSAIADCNVEFAVGSKMDGASIVIAGIGGDPIQNNDFAADLSHIGIAGVGGKAAHPVFDGGLIRVIDIYKPVGGKVGIKGNAQKPALAKSFGCDR